MVIIGVDYHPSDQYIAFVDTETGESSERRLNHSDGEAEKFYRELTARGVIVRVGMEATGYSRWFERLLPSRLGAESGESGSAATVVAPASIGANADADHEPAAGLALNEGKRRKKRLWSEHGRAQLEKLPLATWASRRRQDLLELLDRMNPRVEELTAAVEQEARKRPEVLRLMTHPGVGPLTALAFVMIIGTPERFRCGKQIGSYVGLIPSEESSAGHQRLGHISKQGNSLLRFLLVEAAQAAVRCDSDWRRRFLHLAMRRERRIAKVAMARRLAVRLYWMWRNGWEYAQS